MGKARRHGLFIVIAAILTVSTARAEPLAPEAVPPELRAWIPWVLDELGDESCTLVEGERVCAWLGRLAIDASQTGATFRFDVLLERRTRLPLPGSTKHWPQEVNVAGTSVVVLDASGTPQVTLDAGAHTVEGRLVWKALPDVLAVPAAVARVAVTIGERVDTAPRREEDGSVWLGGEAEPEEGSDEPAGPERLDIEVMRRIHDGVPLVVTTRIELRVGGRPREARLPSPLLEGGELLRLDAGGLAARFDADGELVLEVKKGDHAVTIYERHLAAPEKLALKERPAPWPAEEVWAWSPNVSLRQAEVTGGSPIDPSRTNVPQDWRSLPMFKLRAPTELAMKTLRRGHPEPPPNKLQMFRRLWLDLDGEGYTVVDSLRGQMHRDWRLRFLADGELGHVSASMEDQLITLDGDKSGVEVRQGHVDVSAEWRGASAPATLPAVGWSTDVEALNLEVRLPPGWELLGASGVDEVSPNRWSDWEVLDVLWILAIALGVGKLTRWPWAPVAAVALVLAHESMYAPMWVWGALALTTYALRAVPEGRRREALRLAWWGSAALALYGLVVFTALEVRQLLYPRAVAQDLRERELELKETEVVEEQADNKEGGTGARAKGGEGSMGQPNAPSPSRYGVAGPSGGIDPHVARQQALEEASEFGMIGLLNKGAGGDTPAQAPWGKDQAQSKDMVEQDAKAVVQTGHGVPHWQYTTASLTWVGPVEQGHQIRLWLLSPRMRLTLTLLAIALNGWLWWLLLRTGRDTTPPKPKRNKAAAAAAVALCLSFAPQPARADAPPKELLDELKARITRAPECSPDCVTVARLTGSVEGRTLRLEAEVHAGATATYQMPGPAESWMPSAIEVDGAPSNAITLHGGHLHLRLRPGTHKVVLSGAIRGNELTLALGTLPHRARFDAARWDVSGIDEDGSAEPSIHLSAKDPGDTGTDETPIEVAEPKALTAPPWLEVTRALEAGVKWTMHTRLRRVSVDGTPIVLRFPLLEGEKVTDGGFPQEGREVVITLDRSASEATFRSALEPVDSLPMTAALDQPWSEIWTLQCSAVWRCSSDGIAPVSHVVGGVWQPTFLPWPGEKVTFQFQRPPPAPGRTLTIQEGRLQLQPKDRVDEASLSLTVHTSVGGVHEIAIPTGVRVARLDVDGAAQPAEGAGGKVQVTLKPGRSSIVVEWTQPGGIGWLYRAPEVVLGDHIANAHVGIELPHDRWLIYAGGPRWGVDIQFWGYLVLLVVLGIALGRIPNSPLKSWQWALLAAGLTQAPHICGIIIAAWFFVITYRRSWKLARRGHNAAQIGVALWTLVFAACLAMTSYQAMAERPDMMVVSDEAATGLQWYADQTGGALPQPWVLSGPIWLWRLVMAAWSAYVVWLLIPWAKTAWRHFNEGGLWIPKPKKAPKKTPKPEAEPSPAEAIASPSPPVGAEPSKEA